MLPSPPMLENPTSSLPVTICPACGWKDSGAVLSSDLVPFDTSSVVHLHSTPLHLPDTFYDTLLTPTLNTMSFKQLTRSGFRKQSAVGVYGRPTAIIYTIAKQICNILFPVTHSSPEPKLKISKDPLELLGWYWVVANCYFVCQLIAKPAVSRFQWV